jgi:ribosome maturation factor RimP
VARPSDADLRDAIRVLAQPIAERLELEVLEIVVKGSQGSRVVRLVVDAAALDPQVGIGIDDIAVLSRDLEDAVDREDPIPGPTPWRSPRPVRTGP